MTLIIIVGLALALFALAFITRRRFGVLGLALAAGSLLAQTLGSWLEDVIAEQSFSTEPLSTATATLVLLTIAPSLLLMFSGPRYSVGRAAFIGALLYAVLGTLLVLGPLTSDLPTLESGVRDVLLIVAEYQNWIIASGILLALLDIMQIHSSGSKSKKDKKH